MAYEVLARKWRPQQFADVVGQGHVTQTLANAIKANRIAHAYLFVGPRGIGKTSLARIFAKALNCRKGPTATPCDVCEACKEIMSGSSMDVMEIDGASNNGVDQVRELRENVKYAPTRGPYKIYIIDEVHMLSPAAFNALLKTLEEPPPHVKFIFATTESQKVLPTIVSRCQRFDLRRISAPQIVERLQLIAKAEGVTLEDDAALAIARGAEGGLRDAESALDQLIAFRGERIAEDDVLAVFGLVARHTLEALAEAVLKGDVPELIRIVAEFDAGGKDMQRVLLELLDHLRNLLVYQCAPQAVESMDVLSTQVQAIEAQAALADADRLLRMAEVLAQAEDRIRYALSRRTLLETALIRCARSTTVSIDALIRRVEELQGGADGGGGGGTPVEVLPRPAPPTAAAPRPSAPRVSEPAVPGYAAPATPRRGPAPAAAPSPAASAALPKTPGAELEALVANWRALIDKIGALASLARGALIDARPLEVTAERVTIGFDPEFAQNIERMRAPTYQRAAQSVVAQFLKRPVTIEYRLIESPSRVDVPADHTVDQAGGGGAPGRKGARTRQQWQADPVVRKTLEIFNGSIVDIRE